MRHINVDRWFDKTSTGTLRAKRVSAAKEAQFPKKYRAIYQKHGVVRLVKQVCDDRNISLAPAWDVVKHMFND